MKKVYILAFMVLMGQSSWAQIREFQTTRLNSTAGAGVASVLSTEAALLNPAGAAFFTDSGFSYQSYSTSLQHKSDERSASGEDFDEGKASGYFISDHSGAVKGGVTYIDQSENEFDRKLVMMHGAVPMGKASSMGVSYRYITDVLPKGSSRRHFIHHQVAIGTQHIVDEDTIVGLLIVDPTRTTKGEERAFAGFQYNLTAKLALIGDVGAQYTKDVLDKYIWRGAAQLTLFDDFFLRAGMFYDNIREYKGTGWGLGWIGPRLGIEFGQKFSDQFGDDGYIFKDETLVDTSLSAIIKF